MTPAEADSRIILSRHTLAKFVQMIGAGVDPVPGTLVLVSEEIAILQAIAEEHPGKVKQLVVLATEWIAFREGVQVKVH